MENKKLGMILIIIGILISAAIFFAKAKEDALINQVIEQQDSCYLPDGTCLHQDRNITGYIIGWVVSGIIVALGLYLIIFEKSQKAIVSALKEKEKKDDSEQMFNILLKGLDADEQKVIKAIREQDGITQQTLRLRTDLHKSKLSIILDRMEKKGLVARVEKGKTKQVFLKINI